MNKIHFPHPTLKPMKHQKSTVDFLLRHPKAFNFSDIGTGKTLSTAWAIHNLYIKGLIKTVLVVAPLSALVDTWKRTLETTLPWAKVKVIGGNQSPNYKLETYKNIKPKDILIINPDSLHIIAMGGSLADLVVTDETAQFRNGKTRRYRALHVLSAAAKGHWGLSGNPQPESPLDVWPMGRLITPDTIPRFITHFRDMTMRRIGMWDWRPKPDAEQMVAKMLGDVTIRFKRSECDLPKEHEGTIINCEPSKLQLEALKRLKEDMLLELRNNNSVVTAVNAGILVNKLLQVCSGFVYPSAHLDPDNINNTDLTPIHLDCESKIAALQDILESTDGPVIVYVPFTEAINILHQRFEKVPHRVIDGRTSEKDRLIAFDLLRESKIKMLIANPAAMQYSISLTRSNTIVWFTLVHSHNIYHQANGRIRRPGQERETYILHLISSSVEKRVFNSQMHKMTNQQILLGFLED